MVLLDELVVDAAYGEVAFLVGLREPAPPVREPLGLDDQHALDRGFCENEVPRFDPLVDSLFSGHQSSILFFLLASFRRKAGSPENASIRKAREALRCMDTSGWPTPMMRYTAF